MCLQTGVRGWNIPSFDSLDDLRASEDSTLVGRFSHIVGKCRVYWARSGLSCRQSRQSDPHWRTCSGAFSRLVLSRQFSNTFSLLLHGLRYRRRAWALKIFVFIPLFFVRQMERKRGRLWLSSLLASLLTSARHSLSSFLGDIVRQKVVVGLMWQKGGPHLFGRKAFCNLSQKAGSSPLGHPRFPLKGAQS